MSNVQTTHLLSTTRLACLVSSLVSGLIRWPQTIESNSSCHIACRAWFIITTIPSNSLDPLAGAMYIRSSSIVSISDNTSFSTNSAFESGGENGEGNKSVWDRIPESWNRKINAIVQRCYYWGFHLLNRKNQDINSLTQSIQRCPELNRIFAFPAFCFYSCLSVSSNFPLRHVF